MAAHILKNYQRDALESLAGFLRTARMRGAKAAFEESGYGYRSEPFGKVPCVCLRIPTGGGKTLLAAHAIPCMAKEWLDSDAPTALWLTPSDTIRSQTIGALQSPGHPYREALEQAYGHRFQVCDLEAVTAIPPQDWGRQAVIVVATIQSFRIEETGLRNVYAFNEAFEPHFRGLPARRLAGLSAIPDALVSAEDAADANSPLKGYIGKPKYSLSNWLALQQPIVIVDEAHNTKTERSFEALKRMAPAVILELTATPIPKKTNVLYHVSAQELQAENMVKLPIMLMEHPQGWEVAVFDAMQTQRKLEAEAQKEADYIRPIVLFQAQNATERANAQALRKHLIEELHIPTEQIAVATGDTRELEGIDLLAEGCPIRFVITVQALREGWDCPFAYVLCSVQPVRSATAVEQLLGRVLRMPYARRRASAALNKAYAHVSESHFGEAASALADRLIQGMGFEALDVASMIAPQLPLPGVDDGPLFRAAALPQLTLEMPGKIELPALDNVRVETTDKGKRVIVTGHVNESLAERLTATQRGDAKKEETQRAIEQHNAIVAAQSAPVSRGETFGRVPWLCYRSQGELELVERQAVLEKAGLDLLADKVSLPGFQVVEQANAFEVYLEGAKVKVGQADAGQLELGALNTSVTEDDLVRWLDREVRQSDIVQSHLRAYLKVMVVHLLHEQRISLSSLARARFQLAQCINARIEDLRTAAAGRKFKQLVLDGGWEVAVAPERSFSFLPGNYAVSATDRYRGKWDWHRHFYPVVAKLEDGTEEFKCAIVIDSHPKVKHWVRNLERDVAGSFWLPTSRGRFFPDFICELTDGRIFIVEYKGEHLRNVPSEIEKDQVGRLWAERSAGKCLFLMAFDKDAQERDMRAQLDAAIAGSESA
jgi:type III restriction enzyme